MTDEPHTTDPIAEARQIVAEADEALAALPATRAHHAALVRRKVLANAAAARALDDLWPLLSEVCGVDAHRDAVRAQAWRTNEAAMTAMWAAGDAGRSAETEVGRLVGLAEGPLVDEARRIVAAADDLVVLRHLVNLSVIDDEPEPVRRRRV